MSGAPEVSVNVLVSVEVAVVVPIEVVVSVVVPMEVLVRVEVPIEVLVRVVVPTEVAVEVTVEAWLEYIAYTEITMTTTTMIAEVNTAVEIPSLCIFILSAV